MDRGPVKDGDVRWSVHSPRPIDAGEEVLLKLSYTGGEKGGVGFYIGPEVTVASQLTSWYPLVDGENKRGVGTLRLQIPPGRTAVADELKLQSTPAELAQNVFRYEISHPTYFVFCEGPFTVARRSGTIPVSAYLLSPPKDFDAYSERIARLLEALAQEFGPYPFDQFALVEIPREILHRSGTDGTAFLGGLIVSENSLRPPDFSLALPYVAHEASHQWWPFMVRVTGPGGRYMAESLAQLGSLRAVEALMGAEAAERYRSHGFPDWGNGMFSSIGYLKLIAAGYDAKLGELPEAPDGQRLMYVKGLLVWDMLSRELGRDEFRRVLRQIASRHAFQTIAWKDFWRAIEKGSGKDLGWFYDQWFDRTGAPDWQLTWEQKGNTVQAVVTQSPPYFRATLEIEAAGDGGQNLTRSVQVSGPRTELQWPVGFSVERLTLP